jgi:hypothetical protein
MAASLHRRPMTPKKRHNGHFLGCAGQCRDSRRRSDAEARWLAHLGATITGALSTEGLDHHAVRMKDP